MGDDLDPQPPADELDWKPIMAWRDRIASDIDAGLRDTPAEQDDGSFPAGHAVTSDEAYELMELLYESQVVAGFDWPGWMDGRGRDLADDPALLDDAGLEDCRRLLTAIARGDRFNGGLFLRKLRDGTIHRTLQRVDALLADAA